MMLLARKELYDVVTFEEQRDIFELCVLFTIFKSPNYPSSVVIVCSSQQNATAAICDFIEENNCFGARQVNVLNLDFNYRSF